MIKFSAKDLKQRGRVITLTAKDGDNTFVVIKGAERGGKFSLYILAASSTKGPVILAQPRNALVPFNALVEINRQLTKWHNQRGPDDSKVTKTETLNKLTRQRLKAIMRIARLWAIDDIVADKTEFEMHFG